MLVDHRVTLSLPVALNLPVPIDTPGRWEETFFRVKFLVQEHNKMTLAMAQSWTLLSSVRCTNHYVALPSCQDLEKFTLNLRFYKLMILAIPV